MASSHGATLGRVRVPADRAGVVVVAADRAVRGADAVCASNDAFAISLLTELTRRRIRVPDDIALIGVDDIPLAASVTPALTTVSASFGEWGAAMAREVVDALSRGDRTADLPPLPTRVVVRDTA